MICEICRDEGFLAQKAEAAGAEDLGTAQDLLDTLIAHKDGCVGMAANMIGVCKRIIAFDNEGKFEVMLNPEIIKQSGAYEAEEGCLSLDGTRKALPHDKGALAQREASGAHQDLHRLHRRDNPARDRPL